MRYLRPIITALLMTAVMAPFAYSKIVHLPSGDGTPNLGLEWMTSHSSPWRGANGCLARNYSTAPGNCFTSADFEGVVNNAYHPYYGQPLVKEMVCSSTTELTLTSTWTLRLAYRGGSADPDTVTYLSEDLVFAAGYVRGQTLRVAVNDRPTVADGSFLIIITAMTQDGADTDPMRINCTVN